MTLSPLVTVLMPVRDAAPCVAAAVRSVQAQSLADWELVVVEDGSRDGTAEVLRALAGEDARIRVLRTEPRGIAPALQTGCDAARGQFIARLDADDVMHPRRLELQAEFLRANADSGLVSCRVDYGGGGAGYAAHVDWVNALLEPETMALRRFVEAPVAHPSVMFRRELIAKHGGYRDGAFPEDYELWLRWLEAGVRFAKLPEALLTWNDPPGRLSRTDPRYAVESFYAVKMDYLARWLRTHVEPDRELWLCGAGRVTRRRFAALAEHGARLAGYIDVDPAKAGRTLDGLPVRLLDNLPPRESSFLLAGVAARGAREAYSAHLTARGWVEGRDFLLVA